jgi:hypothetical protein
MTLVEKMVATAFYKGYSLSFAYVKGIKDGEKSIQRRRLATVSDIKHNKDDEILVGGCIDNHSYEYRQFFLADMSDIQVFKKIDIAELSQ